MSRTYPFFFALIRTSFVLLLLVIGFTSGAAGQSEPSGADTYLLRFRPATTPAEQQAVLAALDVIPLQWVQPASVVQVAPRNPDVVFASHVPDSMAPYLEYIEADTIVTGDLTPNDPAFSATSQVYGQNIVEAPHGWDLSTGVTNTIIAIVDSGINPDHPEFAGRVLAGYDFINDDAAPIDDHGHGTHVAGIAAAALNNAQGGAGVCPQCAILPVKVLDSGNKGTWGTVASGIYFAVDHGARVINLSLGATSSSRTLEDAVRYAEEHDVLVVASSGNAASSTPYYPAALPYVIAVGATNDSDAQWPLSNMGDHLDLSAPGYRIYSTCYNLEQNGGYTVMSGTSMASPFVTGLIGLLAGFAPSLTGAEIYDTMITTADDLGASGKDAIFGYGRINVYRALVAANDGVEPSEPPTGDNPSEPDNASTPAPLYLPLVAAG